MPLTTRTNGSSSPNIVTAAWWNDYKDLLTGVMQDQNVRVKNTVTANAIGAAPSSAAGGSLATGATLGIGVYKYWYTYVSTDGESLPSPVFSITTTSGNQKVNLTGITTGPTGTIARKVYRTTVGGYLQLLLTTINDNSTTTYSDTTADGSLTTQHPGYDTFGGAFQTKDSGGTLRSALSNDGTMNLYPPTVVVNGSTSGTATFTMVMRGAYKLGILVLLNFRNGSAPDQTLTFPVPYNHIQFYVGQCAPFEFRQTGSNLNNAVITGLASGGGTTTAAHPIKSYSIGDCGGAGTPNSIDSIAFIGSQGSAAGGITIFQGY